jgi:Uma2 family endonuclease
MADNTLQFRWIVTIRGGLDAVFAHDPNVFVAGDLLWYPVEGNPLIRIAPDILVAFGRPKGDRGSYLQWQEDNIAPQVVWEVLSPNNRPPEMLRKFEFYQRYGVEEYYLYDPDAGEVLGWRRVGEQLQGIPSLRGWVSPRLGVRFEIEQGELALYGPDSRRFATYVELVEQRQKAEQEQVLAEELRQIADEQRKRAEEERRKAQERAERLAAQLRAAGLEPEA